LQIHLLKRIGLFEHKKQTKKVINYATMSTEFHTTCNKLSKRSIASSYSEENVEGSMTSLNTKEKMDKVTIDHKQQR